MIFVRVIGCIILLAVCAALLGRLLYGKKKSGFLLDISTGFFLLFAIFEVVALPCIFLKISLKWFALVLLGIIGVLCVILLIANGRHFLAGWKVPKWEKAGLLLVVVLFLILSQTGMLGFGMHIDDDDAFYVATAVTAMDTNTLFQVDPYTGALYGALPSRYVLSSFPLFGAAFCKYVGLRPTVFFHTMLPFVMIPVAYAVYALIGRKIFGKNKEKNILFLGAISVINIFSAVSTWTQGQFLLVRIWQGKAILASILLPFLIYFVLEYFPRGELKAKEFCLLLFIMLASCFVSSMGIILSVIMLESFSFLQLVRTRKLKLFLQTTVCCVPNVLLAAIYLMMR